MLPVHRQRKKYIHEQHEAGRTYVSLAKELGITPQRVRQLDLSWKHYLNVCRNEPLNYYFSLRRLGFPLRSAVTYVFARYCQTADERNRRISRVKALSE